MKRALRNFITGISMLSTIQVRAALLVQYRGKKEPIVIPQVIFQFSLKMKLFENILKEIKTRGVQQMIS